MEMESLIFAKKKAMSQPVTPYDDRSRGKKQQVTEMFDTISKEYDGLNRVISFGIDLRWRKKVIQWVASFSPDTVLDIATGTGDLAVALCKTTASKIVGLDISPGMLAVGKQKVKDHKAENRVSMILGDGEKLPFQDAHFDAVTIAFGVRNFENLNQGLSEVYRVLKKNGALVILETSVPTNPLFKLGYFFHTRLLLPLIGRVFSKDKVAYSYLSESAAKFPFGDAFNNILQKNGFTQTKHYPQTMGVATIYVARK